TGSVSARPCRSLLEPRQGEIERGALARLSLRPGPAAVAVDDAPDVRQADPRALELLRAMETLEHAEELGGVLHVEADAVVADEDHDLVAGAVLHADLDPRVIALARVLDRIGHEVGQGQPQHRGIPRHAGQGRDAPVDRAAVRLRLAV